MRAERMAEDDKVSKMVGKSKMRNEQICFVSNLRGGNVCLPHVRQLLVEI